MTSELQTFLRVLPRRWWRKPVGIDMERNYVTVTACIGIGPHPHEKQYLCIYRLHAHCCFMNKFVWFIYIFCDGFAVTISSVNLLPFRMDSFMFIQKSKYLNLFLIYTVTVLGLQFSARIYPIRFWSKEVNHGWLNLVLFICYFRFFWCWLCFTAFCAFVWL